MPVDFMTAHLNRELLRYAVQRQITCRCGDILDVRRAVLIDSGPEGPTAVACGRCFDAAVRKGLDLTGLDITDGRPREQQGWRKDHRPRVTRTERELCGQQALPLEG
jgi:hypothetical protein